MKNSYYYADPTGNITLLAPLLPDGADIGREAKKLMTLEPSAEQVGFLGNSGAGYDISLQMAGGEFCGNATLSAAAVFCINTERKLDDAEIVRVSASGAAAPVPVLIKQTGNKTFLGTVSMPLPLDISIADLQCDGERFSLPIVRFEGITHLLSFRPLRIETAEKILKEQCSALQADALGIMQIDTNTGTLLPFVYVPKSGTLFREGSCASGTTAAGSWFRKKIGPGRWEFAEPAGNLIIDAQGDGRLLLTGSVSITVKEYS